MEFIPAVWIIESIMKYTLGGQEIRTIFHIDPHESPNTTLLEQVAQAVSDWAASDYMPLLSSSLHLYEVQTIDLTEPTGATASVVTIPAISGADVSELLPNNAAACLSHLTLLRGRSYRGRTYIPGLTIGVADGGNTINLAWAADMLDAFMALITTINTAGWDLVVTSYFANKAPRASAVSTIITELVMNLVMDSQRRRLPGRGE